MRYGRSMKGKTMREILYKNLTSKKNRRRIISVSEKSENKEYRTHTRKTFVYKLSKLKSIKQVKLQTPVFYITKCYNSKTKEEKFRLRIRGVLNVARDGQNYRVDFSHGLKIDIVPKGTTVKN